MADYWYIAKDTKGNRYSGTYKDIANIRILREELLKIGYDLIKARKEKKDVYRSLKIKPREIVAFTYMFAGMYSAGLSVLKCLEALEEQADNPALKGILADVRQHVETGASLKKAFDPYRDIFSDFFLGMIEAGETGGKLGKALETTAVYLEKRLSLRQKVQSAFMYPVIMTVVCFGVIGSLLTFVVPMFSRLYARLHVALPGPTQFLIVLSHGIRDYWFLMLAGGIGMAYLVQQLKKSPEVRNRWDTFKLGMPVFGRLNRMIVVSRFIRTFGTLISVGVPMIDSLNVARRVAGNQRLADVAVELREAIRAGTTVAKALSGYRVFPSVIIQMADAGEQAGVLPDMLSKGADFLDKDIDRVISNLLVKLEPAMTLIMGAVIGLILLAVYLPMFDYMNHLQQ